MYLSSSQGQESEKQDVCQVDYFCGFPGSCSGPLTWLPAVCWQSLELLGLLRHHPALVFTRLFPAYVSVSQFLSLLTTQIILDLRPTLIQYDLIFTNYICRFCFHWFWVGMNFMGRDLIPPNTGGKRGMSMVGRLLNSSLISHQLAPILKMHFFSPNFKHFILYWGIAH